MTESATLIITVLLVFFCLLSMVLTYRLRQLRSRLPASAAEKDLEPVTRDSQPSVFEELPIPVYRKDNEGRFLEVNRAFEEFFGSSRDFFIGKKVSDFNPPDLASIYQAQDQKLLRHGGDQIYESQIKNRRGQLRNVVFHKRALKDPTGQVNGILGMAFDITERKQMEQQLLEQQKMFISLVENLPDIIIRYDKEFRRTYVNPTYFKMTGSSAEQVIGSNTGESWLADLPFSEYQNLLKQVLTTGEIQNCVMSWPDQNGINRLYAVNLVPEKTHTGDVTGIFSIGHDITELKQTEIQFRNLTDNWPDEIASYDTLCRRTFLNPTMARTLEARAGKDHQLLGETPTESFPDLPNIADYEAKLREVLRDRRVCDYEMIWDHDPQNPQYRLVKMLPEYDTVGKISGVFTVARDITEQKRAEIERQKNLEFFANLDRVNRVIQQSNDLEEVMNNTLAVILEIFETDRAFLTFPLDPEADSFSAPIEQTRPEYPGARALGQRVKIDDDYRRMMTIELTHDGPVRFGPESEHPLPAALVAEYQVRSMLAMALYPKVGKPWNFGLHHCSDERIWNESEVRLFNEISKRLGDALTAILSYQSLEDNRNFLDNIFEHLPSMLYVKDAETFEYVRINKSAEAFMGVAEDEILGKTDYDFFSSDIADFHRQKDREALREQALVHIPEEVLWKDGKKHYLQVKKMAIPDRLGQTSFLLVLTEDITNLKLSQEATRKFSQAVKQSPYALIFTDSDGTVEFVNQKFTELTGRTEEEVCGKPVKELLDYPLTRDKLDRIVNRIKETGVWREERKRTHENGTETWELLQVSAIVDEEAPDQPIANFVVITEDITDHKKLESQLQHSQKMEAIGQLAGGVAHDFNNMLGVIVGRTDLALNRLAPEDPLYESLEEIGKAARRSADLTRQLLAFARKQDVAPKILDLNETVEGTLNMLRRLIGEDIHLAWLPSPKLWPINIDPSQLDQILANLCVNARDAISDGGKITIETRNMVVDANYSQVHGEAKPGDYVMMAISDTGCGMLPETIDKIFEPFFTTKELGKGTGLGLSTVYGIIKQNHGFINVYSEPGQGTTFSIYLPRALTTGQAVAEQRTAQPPRGEETILVVEDDQTILATETSMLEMLGYRVFGAATPAEAILLAEQHAGDLQLLITDVIMPGMNGRELAELMTSHYPELKIIFMSGYTGDVIAHHGVLEEGVNFIQKPFSLQTFARKVRETLDKQ